MEGTKLEQFIKKAEEKHNGKYDYSQVVYVNSRTKVTIVCPDHGVFEQLPSSHLQGNGCPKCARIWSDEHKKNLQKSSRKSRGMTTDEWIAKVKEIHGDKYDYSQTIYVNQRTNVKIICPVHGMFEQKADSHLRGCGCRLCGFESENHNGVHNWSDEQRMKTAQTCMVRYGTNRYLDSDEGKAKIAEIKADPVYRKRMHDIISSDDVQSKTKNTCVAKYGVPSAMKLPETVDKVFESKKQNKTYMASKSEGNMYLLLCDRFGDDDVVRQYKDDRYPYHCDFYIKSQDLFIELNASWLHGDHWFDENSDQDLFQLTKWKEKADGGSQFYTVAIRIWTVDDVKKRDRAVANNLNYLVFWKNDLSDFKAWMKTEPLLLNNILN